MHTNVPEMLICRLNDLSHRLTALTRINLTDETVLFTGQQAPCRNCQSAMRKATSNNSATIIYQWREHGQTYQKKWRGNKRIE